MPTIGHIPGVGARYLEEPRTITLVTVDGRQITRLLDDVSKEPFRQGAGGEWRLRSGQVVKRERQIVMIFLPEVRYYAPDRVEESTVTQAD